jgi:hypothetical protein
MEAIEIRSPVDGGKQVNCEREAEHDRKAGGQKILNQRGITWNFIGRKMAVFSEDLRP